MNLRDLGFGDVTCTGLGDVLCFKWEADDGRDAVTQLNTFYASAGSPAQWKAAVSTVNASWAAWAAKTDLLDVLAPSYYCEAKSIGQRAQQLVAQIAAQAGINAPPQNPGLQPGPTQDASDAVISAVKWGVGGLLAVELLKALRGAR